MGSFNDPQVYLRELMLRLFNDSVLYHGFMTDKISFSKVQAGAALKDRGQQKE
jgi:hypothetical protein